ncbi:hypothetical protein GCM10010247_33130 [Streptomyces calvus]|nr:hypothetical protein GCM10010247_33130 [Streptomyces calvus]
MVERDAAVQGFAECGRGPTEYGGPTECRRGLWSAAPAGGLPPVFPPGPNGRTCDPDGRGRPGTGKRRCRACGRVM